jgi:hypothetical protein
MKTILLSIFLFTLSILQAQDLDWAKSFGSLGRDGGNSVAVDALGNVYTTGSYGGTATFCSGANATTLTSRGATDVFVQKMDAAGNLVWIKSFGSFGQDIGREIRVDAFGNVYTTGGFEGSVDFDPGTGNASFTAVGSSDIYVHKLDSIGNFLWVKVFGSSGFENPTTMCIDPLGNVYTAGYFQVTVDFDPGIGTMIHTSRGGSDIFIQKMDASGNFIWAKTFGDTDSESALSMTLDAFGDVHIAGYFSGMVDFDPGAGTTILSSAGNTDAFVQKMDTSGNFLWARAFGGPDYDRCTGIGVDAWGNIYTGGTFQQTADLHPGTAVLNFTATGATDNYVQKIDASGNFLWVKTFGNWDGEHVYDNHVDATGNVYTTGYFYGTLDFDPGVGVTNLTSVGIRNNYVQKLDSSGSFVWAVASRGGAGFGAYGYSLTGDASNNVYITGAFEGSVDFDPGPDSTKLSAVGSRGFYVQKINQCPPSRSTDTVNVCGSYQWIDGNTYTSSTNTPVFSYKSVSGCDSIVSLDLTITSITSTDTLRRCEPYQWIDGNTYSSSTNTPTFTLRTAAGCDSVVTLNLTIAPLTGTDVVQACQSFQWIDGNTYTASTNTPQHTVKTASGCDSIVTLNLTITQVDNSVRVVGATLIANVAGGQYKWYDCNNGYAQIPGQFGQSFTPSQNGSYAVMVGQNGCAKLSDCIDIINVNIEENTFETAISVYPNPFTDMCFIDLGASHRDVRIMVQDAFGKEIFVNTYQELEKTQLELNSPSGVYFIVIEDREGNRAIRKLVKR